MEGAWLLTEYWAWPMFGVGLFCLLVSATKMHLRLNRIARRTKTRYQYRDPVTMALLYAAVCQRETAGGKWALYMLWVAGILIAFGLIGIINIYAPLRGP